MLYIEVLNFSLKNSNISTTLPLIKNVYTLHVHCSVLIFFSLHISFSLFSPVFVKKIPSNPIILSKKQTSFYGLQSSFNQNLSLKTEQTQNFRFLTKTGLKSSGHCIFFWNHHCAWFFQSNDFVNKYVLSFAESNTIWSI